MQLKNSMLLFTALTAGSAVARLHGHDRRHAHHEKRAVGDEIYATINGKLVSWINEWSGHGGQGAAATTTAEAAAPTQAAPANTNAPAPTDAPAPAPADNGPEADWTSTPPNGQFSREGFGQPTTPQSGGSNIMYKGNVGQPWGSNIIEVAADKAKQYRHVLRLKGSNKDPWTVVFWNKMGPDGKMDGWYGHSALTLTLEPQQIKYVAVDDNSQGAWGAAKGEKIPLDKNGGYASTWGEFDFGNSDNNGWSGWDVSAIQAQAAGLEVQGMNICDHTGNKCSTISALAKLITNAYSQALAAVDGIGGSSSSGPVRLDVQLDYE